MYLKRIEMIGFKSFPEKIKLEFNKGITAVVGPNGSGKSNISDAIRWVLGEQSVKSLRGSKMEDVIFAGTSNRKPLGFAEVSLVLDNADKTMKIDFSEVIVTRRLYRSGESEYKLNGVSCRLKDVHELFMDTGIGREGYSIIGQGRIEEILASKGEERRHIFEEAAGIVKFKTRRHEAINKLEKEKQNIIRLNDIIDEIENNLSPLEIQAEKAKEYLAFFENLKLTQINIFLNLADSISERIEKIDLNLNHVSSQIIEYDDAKTQTDAKILEMKSFIENTEQEIKVITNCLTENTTEIETIKNNIKLKQAEKEHFYSDISFYEKELEIKKSAVEEYSKNLDLHQENIKRFSLEFSKKNDELNKASQEFEEFQIETSEYEVKLEEHNAEILKQVTTLSDIKNSYNNTENLYNQTEEKKELSDEEVDQLESSLNIKNHLFSDYSNKLVEINKNKTSIANNISTLASENRELTDREASLTNELNHTLKEKNENSSRLKLLKELEEKFDGYNKSVKSLLQHLATKNLKGIIAPVGEIISVEKKYELAIEIALGNALQNIVTETEEDAKKGIEILKSNKWGRATFLPISLIKERPIGKDRSDILKEYGVLGIADELIEFLPKYKNIISNILGRTIIIDNIDNAVLLSKKHENQYKIVTLNGDIINAGGSITGGSLSAKSTNIFGRVREIEELSKKIDDISKSEAKLRENILSVQKQLEIIRVQENGEKDELHNIEIEEVKLNQNSSQLENEMTSIKDKIFVLNTQNQALMQEIININNDLRQKREEEAKTEKLIQELKENLNKLGDKISDYKIEKDEKSTKITNLKIELSVTQEKLNHEESDVLRLEKEIAENNLSLSKYTNDIASKRKKIENNEVEITKLETTIIELTEKGDSLKKEINEISENNLAYNTNLAEKEETSKNLFIEISNLTNEKNRLEITKENMDIEVRKLYDQMWDEYEITYQEAKNYPKIDKSLNILQSEERSLKNKIRNLGNVNVNAIEEYKLLKERYEFLFSQREDIILAEEKLKEIILKLTELMSSQFYENFNIISENFSKVFAEMFGGGKAYLKLSDKDNILESGIEIIAQPPGKVLQNMSLLSGGERALTATALLFAILKMKPSPFCILDEVEAALDDANVVRYANYLKNFADNTQFILITHRKGVMEAADILYGITMQEQGVSKLVSIKFE